MRNSVRKHLLQITVLALCLTCAAATANAQYGADASSMYGTMTQTNMSNITQMTWGGNLMGKRSSAKRAAKTTPPFNNSKTTATTTTTKTPANTATTSTTFRNVTTSIMPEKMAEKMSANDNTNKLKYQRTFQQFLDGYHKRLKEKNGAANDLPRAIAFFIYSSYTVATGKQITNEQASAGREQLRNAIVEDEEFQRLSDREKQERYESAIILGEFVMFYNFISEQDKDKNLKDKIQKMARQNLENFFGTSFKNVKITNDGIEL